MERHRLEMGLTQVYTGDGKGKTSAAFGLALRAIGRGLKVYMIQFIKGGFDYGELHVVDRIPNFEIAAFGHGRFISRNSTTKEDLEQAREALEHARKILGGGDYDVVVLDEINVAVDYDLISVEDVADLIENKPRHVELVLTGRAVRHEIIEIADLVTEMREVKHPFNRGVQARKGIEY